ncbi:leucine-rich repeat domain-containing protein [Hirsutella rhossiliensis]|uniref:U2 small nuclear ribonucleoprotein A' n=1 Tax=Hirsutella rhossiliensis TaxID=111463 RepID=A0A9P8MYU8_9HYPO|nr:leucine-rich repeat domain-containing protein [Hirsutella rhossiliensis]KAH0964543.1 leucine-rich repeat domain-containing protein [Hirsutella rhossiliensis]
MRLTAELLHESLSYLNPLKERELDLRGQRIPTIENLAVAGPHDAIDFTDNDIQVLGNFPLSPRINTLLVARNRVVSIHQSLPSAIPNLKNLVLASNNLAELADLDVLGMFPRLIHLVLVDNPVTKKEHYRYWVLWRCPSVRFLDYEKVKQVEREKGRELFGTAEEPTVLTTEILGRKTKSFEMSANGSAEPSKQLRMKLTDEEKQRLRDKIKQATSLKEIIALEKELNEGRLPSGLDQDAMEE